MSLQSASILLPQLPPQYLPRPSVSLRLCGHLPSSSHPTLDNVRSSPSCPCFPFKVLPLHQQLIQAHDHCRQGPLSVDCLTTLVCVTLVILISAPLAKLKLWYSLLLIQQAQLRGCLLRELFLKRSPLNTLPISSYFDPHYSFISSKEIWRTKWQPTPVFLPGESHGQRSLGLVGYSPWGRKESDTTERLTLHTQRCTLALLLVSCLLSVSPWRKKVPREQGPCLSYSLPRTLPTS